MKQMDETRAPRISGINVSGEPVEVDYSTHLMNVLLFFEPVSRYSLDAVERTRVMAQRYGRLSVGFWYVMEPRLSCMFHTEIAQKALDRLSLFGDVLFDPNNMIVLQSGVRTVPTAFVVDSNGFLSARYEGEISWSEIERNLQARIAQSGYREELPAMERPELPIVAPHQGSAVRQMGYASGDYVFGNMVVPEANQDFALPDFYLLDTIYPYGAWFVSRDFIEAKSGSTLYISCGRDESVYAFAGSEKGARLRLHTSIESPRNLAIGSDVKETEDGSLLVEVEDYRPYEILSNSGDTDVLVSLQLMSGSIQLFAVEFCPQAGLLHQETRSFRF